MSISEKSEHESLGIVELADDFIIIQPYKKKSSLRWILPLCMIVIVFVAIGIYYKQTRPLVVILPNSEEEIERKIIAGIPSFIDNDTLGLSKHNDSKGVMLVFEPLLPSGRQIQADLGKKVSISAPTISNKLPEGQLFAFTLNQYNSPRIYVVPIDGIPQMLSYGDSPSFSNDGKKIVFHTSVNGSNEIWFMNIDGSDRKYLYLKGRNPESSSSRDEVVFESSISGKTWNIWTAKISNPEGSLKVLTEGKINCLYPSFSPDGRLILFYKEGDGLWVMKSNGSRQQRILKTNKKSVVMMGRISPDGKRLVVWSGSSKNDGKILLYKINSKVKQSPKADVDFERLAEQIKSINGSEENEN